MTASAAAQEAAPPPEAQPQGLQGVMPPEIPRDIDFESLTEPFRDVSPEWLAWGEQTAELVSQLYFLEGQTIAEQRQLLAQIRERVQTLRQAIDSPRNASLQNALIELHGRLLRRVDVAEAVLDVLDQDLDAPPTDGLPSARQEVLAALDRLRGHLGTLQGGEAWLAFVRADELARALSPDAPAGAALPLAEDVLSRLESAGQLPTPEQRAFAGRPEFQVLEAAVRRYVLLAGNGPLGREAIRTQLANLLAALEVYEQTGLGDAARDVRTIWRNLRTLLGGRLASLGAALRTHYFGFNVQIFGSEDFLNQLIQQLNKDEGPVCDFMLGARVSGWQWTTSATRLDLLPHPNQARYEVQLEGVTQTQTQGVTPQATVYTAGFHKFWALKEILFDGQHFTPLPSRIAADVNSRTVGIETLLSCIPILGRIAERIALRRVEQLRPRAEAIGRGRLVNRIGQELDRETFQSLQRAESDLQNDTYARLRQAGLYPEVQIFSTTDTMLRSFNRVWDDDELGGGTINPALTQSEGATLHLHESLLNHAADQMNLRGRTMTPAEVEQEFERYLSLVTGRDVNIDDTGDQPSETDENRFIFPEKDPLRFQVTDGQLLVIIRAGLTRPDDEPIPTQVITVPYEFHVEEDAIVITRGTVIVAPLEAPENAGAQIARANAMRQQIEESLPEEQRRDRKFTYEREDNEGHKTEVPIWVTRIEAVNGWAILWAK